MDNTITIKSHRIVVQSCCLDRDNDLQANVGISNGQTITYKYSMRYHHITIDRSDVLSYPYLVAKRPIGQWEWSHKQYDEFLRANFKQIKDLIISLLEPEEKARLVQMVLPGLA